MVPRCFYFQSDVRKDCHKPYWKERFIDGLPPIFTHKVTQVLMGKNDSIDYDNLTYGNIFSAIKKLGNSGVVFSVSLSVSTRNFGTPLL